MNVLQSVTIPSGISGGETLLNVAHFYLLGVCVLPPFPPHHSRRSNLFAIYPQASATPILEYANVTVNLDNSTSASSTSNAARRGFIRGREIPELI